MYDSNDLLKIIKQAAINAVNASKPVNIVFGTVISTSPLQIQIEQKLTLGKEQLVVAKHLTNYPVTMNVYMDTDNKTVSFDFSHSHNVKNLETTEVENHKHKVSGSTDEKTLSGSKSHKHNISGDFNVIIKNGLMVGEKVILVRMQEGQKYIVLDRIGG